MMRIYKYNILITVLIVSIFSSCEVDDICTEELITPRLVVGLYDTNDHEVQKTVNHLYVWAVDHDSLYVDQNTDQLLLPLDVSQTQTTYFLSAGGIVDTLIITYENNEIFVSRSCGYTYNFTVENNPALTHNWTVDSEVTNTPQLIENEEDTHIKIYH